MKTVDVMILLSTPGIPFEIFIRQESISTAASLRRLRVIRSAVASLRSMNEVDP